MYMHPENSFLASEKVSLAVPYHNISREMCGTGLVAGTMVETSKGWRPVETLSRGSFVSTYDGGFCPIIAVSRRSLQRESNMECVHIPGGAMDNCSDFSVMPKQNLLVVSTIAEEVLGRAAVLIPAADLVGYNGIVRRTLNEPVEVLDLRFASDEMVYVNSGALIHCAGTGTLRGAYKGSGFFDLLDAGRAAAMLSLIADGARNTADLAQAA